MTLDQYIESINKRYKLGNATEHTFRGDLQTLLESLVPDISATNEPKRQSCGAPDYILTKKEIPVGFIEAKDIGDSDLDGAKKNGNKEQFDRYKASLNNLIFTDYLDFHLYIDGNFITKIAIAEIKNGTIAKLPNNFATFTNLIKDFCSHKGQTIKSPKKLAEMMAGKARLLSDVIEKALNEDIDKQSETDLFSQLIAFKDILIHDITPKGFADVYAQTIAYGMFAARLHDTTLPTFSRQEAAELIPKSNPFLRKLFGYIAGPELDDRIKWIVDSLVEIFLACNVEEILKNYNPHRASPKGGGQSGEDPIIHFYETFLTEYDPKLRKARGVWYTPAPVVNFIVRAVDDILKTEFDLPQGLADNSKTKINVDVQGKQVEQEVHKVQILDPATGTGTFLAEVIKHIHKKFEGQQGIWSNYVETHLLPRLNGFELLMASYAMAHLQLDLLLTETGYKTSPNPSKVGGHQRLRVYLTNSLEESHPDTGTLFANWLSTEANEANHIKRDTPVMCVIGNPPYSGISSNNGEWISKLIEDYKYVDGVHFNERKHWLNDDYVKFLRYGQHFIEKNGSGILAFINPHGFLDNPTFRGMRWNLLNTYDKIYTVDLHGNSKKKEKHPDGSPDVNVFDIMQGVSINIFVKTGKKKLNELGKVFHFDLFGKREMKYDFLIENDLKTIEFKELKPNKPNFFFIPKNDEGRDKYENGFAVNELFTLNNTGIVTGIDRLSIFPSKQELKNTIERILAIDNPFEVYQIKDSRRTTKEGRIDDLRNAYKKGIIPINYRPFDVQYTLPFEKNEFWINSPRTEVMQHFLKGENIGLVTARQCVGDWKYIFCTKLINEFNLTGTAGRFGSGNTFPLYLYPSTNGQQNIEQKAERTPNLNMEIVKQIAEKLDLTFTDEKTPLNLPKGETLSPSIGGVGEVKQRQGGVGYVTANPLNYKLIKEVRDRLKDNPTEAETVIWEHFRNKKTGYKIRRQHIIDDFITDFVCLSKKVVIEIDGKIHLNQKEYDELRTIRLNDLGYEVIRFTNEEVFSNPQSVALKVKDKLDGKLDIQSEVDPVFPPLEGLGEVFAPIDILDYIYAVLHSPTYREKYKEFLKIDFPRVPYPKDAATFWQLVKLGGEIRQIHLLESKIVEKYITQYPLDGNHVVGKLKYVSTPLNLPKGETLRNELVIEVPPLEGFREVGTPNLNMEIEKQITEKLGLTFTNEKTPLNLPKGETLSNELVIEVPPLEGFREVGKVYINDTQYFDNVPQVAWEFYIGGYQPAQKWLKDRKERKLEFDDILHYQKIIVALSETDRLMKEIDKIEIE